MTAYDKRRPVQGRRSKTINSSQSTTVPGCLFCPKIATSHLYSKNSATDYGVLTAPLCSTCSSQLTGLVAMLGGDVSTWLTAAADEVEGARPLTRREQFAGERQAAATMADMLAKAVKS